MHGLDGRRVTVMGLGRFGGGVGVTRWLLDQGATVRVTDLAPETDLGASVDAVRAAAPDEARLTLRLGGHDERDFVETDLVVANPAVPRPWTNRYLLAAAAAGVPVTTEIRLLVERLDRARVIGITGSAGKSTTAAMTHHVFVARGVDARLGGNLGGSLLGDLATIADDTVIVLELSSAMLYWLDAGVGRPDAPAWTPRVGVVTNITPNHVDWHGTFEHYAASKRRLLLDPRPGDVRIDGADLEPLETTLAVPGRHNRQNAAVAIAAVRAMRPEITAAQATEALATYASLPHRLRRVHEADGRVFYDDSKSTTPEACRLAVEAFDRARSVHLIAGGYDKGVDLSPIGAMGPSLGGLYVIGSTADAIALAAGGTAERCGTLEVAVRAAVARMASGDVLLLSPGCASWDQFENYEQRGRRFAELVRAATTPARREAT